MHVRALCDSRNIVFLSKKWLETGSNLLRGFMFHINKNICLSSFTYGMFACCKQEDISFLYIHFSLLVYLKRNHLSYLDYYKCIIYFIPFSRLNTFYGFFNKLYFSQKNFYLFRLACTVSVFAKCQHRK